MIPRYTGTSTPRQAGRYPRLLPYGPHNLWDVLATHILKQTGFFAQASYAIWDTPRMVAQYYGRPLRER